MYRPLWSIAKLLVILPHPHLNPLPSRERDLVLTLYAKRYSNSIPLHTPFLKRLHLLGFAVIGVQEGASPSAKLSALNAICN
jgi:hypothetical protein